jgi:hypothetical protein
MSISYQYTTYLSLAFVVDLFTLVFPADPTEEDICLSVSRINVSILSKYDSSNELLVMPPQTLLFVAEEAMIGEGENILEVSLSRTLSG